MLMPLLVALASSASPSHAVLNQPRPLGPAVQVWLSHRKTTRRGVRAKVYAQTSGDGYLLVFHADATGRVRILFPRSPGEDQFVLGGRPYELWDPGAAAVDDTTGSGIIMAVAASTPFWVNQYIRDQQWDLRSLTDDLIQGDATSALLTAARAMQPGEGVRYDVASYAVPERQHPKPNPRQYAVRDQQNEWEQSGPVRQEGTIHYPLAYGYSTSGWYPSGGSLSWGFPVSALSSFPYRYDQFYRGARKAWW
jgi:hypothetical protein